MDAIITQMKINYSNQIIVSFEYEYLPSEFSNYRIYDNRIILGIFPDQFDLIRENIGLKLNTRIWHWFPEWCKNC
jgi:hypothetical protein